MRVILATFLLLVICACGLRQRANESHESDGVLVYIKDQTGEHWMCLAADGGGSGMLAYLVAWQPDADGNCYKKEKTKE